ncbi:phosphate signaling complex protein PhoU [Yoonia sp.]|uniref:phosphate signaling complex protein PhoU n=1 Tax=Yoonia sp. TaxID=2212373 RepID=UPI003919EC5E|nr:phosphate signaling complex protein PhoU [Loktanella sp.]
MKPHTNTAFDHDLQELQTAVLRMGGLVEAAISKATKAFVTRDQDLAHTVVTGDKQIDALETEINSAVVRMLALRQPAASDLHQVVSVMKVAGDLERLGDYAKNLGKRVPVLNQSDLVEGAGAAVKGLSTLVQSMLKDVLDAYVRNDLELAKAVLDKDREVDQMTNAMFRELLTHMMEDPRSITVCMHLLFIAKNFERMGDHVTEIGEQIIFVETGEQPAPRQKGESTSMITDPPGADA